MMIDVNYYPSFLLNPAMGLYKLDNNSLSIKNSI